jgi:hypothetical protein
MSKFITSREINDPKFMEQFCRRTGFVDVLKIHDDKVQLDDSAGIHKFEQEHPSDH